MLLLVRARFRRKAKQQVSQDRVALDAVWQHILKDPDNRSALEVVEEYANYVNSGDHANTKTSAPARSNSAFAATMRCLCVGIIVLLCEWPINPPHYL